MAESTYTVKGGVQSFGNLNKSILRNNEPGINELYKEPLYFKPGVIDWQENEEKSEPDEKPTDIDELLKSDIVFMTPSEYYASVDVVTTEKDALGFLKNNAGVSSMITSWFWCEDLHNWCAFTCDCVTELFTNRFNLYVWNGKDGWVKLEWGVWHTRVDDTDISTAQVVVNENEDTTNISAIQNEILRRVNLGNYEKNKYKFAGNLIIHDSGRISILGDSIDNSKVAWWNTNEPMSYVLGLKLRHNSKYSINDTDSFQTVRWSGNIDVISGLNDGSMTIGGANGKAPYQYLSTNGRKGITTGCPCIWRLPDGSLFLAVTLEYNGDNGYNYKYHKNGNIVYKSQFNSDLGATEIDISNGTVEGLQATSVYKLLGEDMVMASKFINDVAARTFGKGNDKTIKQDWLRAYNIDTTESMKNNSLYNNLLDSNKTYEQREKSQINNMKLSLKPNRPIVTTVDGNDMDYVRKW